MFQSSDTRLCAIDNSNASRKGQALWQVMLGCLLACFLSLAVGALALPHTAYAVGNGPAVGSTFTVPVSNVTNSSNSANKGSGNLTFKVTKQSKASGIGEVALVDGTQYVGTSAMTLDLTKVYETTTGEKHSYYITCVDRYAFKGNTNLYNIKFGRSLTGTSTNDPSDNVQRYENQAAIGSHAFYMCTNLATVTFSSTQLEGIGDFAFANCTNLTTVSFPEKLVMKTKPIYNRAFLNCEKLSSFTVPAILCATRGYDVTSGYQTYWHGDTFCIKAEGICAAVFEGCDALESITFRAGNTYGMFAYWKGAGCGLRYLTKLKTVIYEGTQPYFGSNDGSLTNQQQVVVWGDGVDSDTGATLIGADPTFYYSVDYYYTSDLMTADTQEGSDYRAKRLARVEYARGTSVADIQAGNAEALADCVADSSLYAQLGSDGTVPDPNEAAKAAQALYEAGAKGYEAYEVFKDADEYQWVWYLDSNQSRRKGLADSCGAYLVRADSLEAGRLESDPLGANQIEAMYRVAGQNLGVDTSKASDYVQNTAFDIERYYNDGNYRYDQSLTDKDRQQGTSGLANMANPLNETATMTPWFTLDSGGLLTLADQMTLYDGAGNELDLADSSKFTITYERYVDGSYETVDATSTTLESGPLLMTITPVGDADDPDTWTSGYDPSTCLKEWILINGHTGLILERYATDMGRTWLRALTIDDYDVKFCSTFNNNTGGFAVCLGGDDAASTLLAASYAGLSDGPINTISAEEGYDFALALGDDNNDARAFYKDGRVYNYTDLKKFSTRSDDASTTATSFFKAFGNKQASWGLSDCTWSATALLVNPTFVEESATAAASYAYTQGSPIFYTEIDGSVSQDTLDYLKNFTSVVVIGDAAMISQDVVDTVSGLNSDMTVVRIQGEAEVEASDPAADEEEPSAETAPGNACAISLAMADYLLSDEAYGISCANVAIVVAQSSDLVGDSVQCQNFSGHKNGITLVVTSSADAKAVAGFLREHRQDVQNIRLFGRGGASVNTSAFTLYDKQDDGESGVLIETWDEEASDVPAVEAGDTVELYGVLFDLGENNTLSNPVRLWGTSEVAAGDYVARDADGSEIAYTVTETVPEITTQVDAPVAKTDLVYSGAEQVGVTSGVGYTVTGGEGTDAGTYSATATLAFGYSWSDGGKDARQIEWTIAPAAQTDISVVISAGSATYTGNDLTPTVSSVTLADGTKLSADAYVVSYSAGKQSTSDPVDSILKVGDYTVVVTLTGNLSGTALVDFTVEAAPEDPADDPADNPADDPSDNPADDPADNPSKSNTPSSSSNSGSTGGSTNTSNGSASNSGNSTSNGNDYRSNSSNAAANYEGAAAATEDSSTEESTAAVDTADAETVIDDASTASASAEDEGDGWVYFDAPGNPEGYDFNATSESSLGFGSSLSAFDIGLLAACVLAVGGAILFATKSRKETDDQIAEEGSESVASAPEAVNA